MAENLVSAYPYGLAYLCNVGSDFQSFHRDIIIPLAWFGLGSAKELLELPLTLLNRYTRILEEEEMVEKYFQHKDPYYKQRRR